jgi:septal ring factor EnvC (AmiA/AmiB activator)
LQVIRTDLGKTLNDSLRTADERSAINDLIRRRAVYAYKHLRRDILKAFLTSSSLGQWLTRREYLERLAAADYANMQRLNQKNMQLADVSRHLNRRQDEESDRLERYRRMVAYKDRLLAEEKSESKVLKERRADREALLKRVRQDKELLARQVEEKKQAAARVESLIKSLEIAREKTSPAPSPAPKFAATEIPFRQLKGRMVWPAAGDVVSRFGLQRNEKLATITENPGIDIGAAEGSRVSSVSAGQVTKITWLRGYGSTVIVDHRDGYYTVYAHLGSIQVHEGQNVRTGEILGQVGQSGSISGPRLHFEIWAQREKQDPLLWLAAK